ncbi:hypothetical protein EBS40_10050, partial [bacterium]|nr:hypothetical protein [bacterium]
DPTTKQKLEPTYSIDATKLPSLAVSQKNDAEQVVFNSSVVASAGIVLSPTVQPAQPVEGQIYYDKAGSDVKIYKQGNFESLVLNSPNKQVCFVGRECGFATTPQLNQTNTTVAVLQQRINNVQLPNIPSIPSKLVSTINNTSGDVTIQGDSNQVVVTSTGTTINLSLPQSIVQSAAPTFAGLTLGSSLSVSSGGTGAASFTQYSLLVGNGSGPVTTTAPASAGLCLISNTGAAPSFQGCPGGVGGASVTATTPGNINRIAKFASGTDLADSSLLDSGILVSSSVPLTVSGIVTADGLTSAGALTITPGSNFTAGATSQKFTLQGNSTSVITAQSGLFTTTVGFTAPTVNRAINFPDEAGT